MKKELCPDCPINTRSRRTEPPDGYTRVTKGETYEVVVSFTVQAENPDAAAEIASLMVPVTHHVSVYAKSGGQEREVLSKRVRKK
jgi:hypothetical protein